MQSWERKPDIHPRMDDWTTAFFFTGVGILVAAGIKFFFIDVQYALPRSRLIQTAVYVAAGGTMVAFGISSHRRFDERWKEFGLLNQIIQDTRAFDHRQQDIWNWRVRENWTELRQILISHEKAFTSEDLRKEVNEVKSHFDQSAISEYFLHEDEWQEWAKHFANPYPVSEEGEHSGLTNTPSTSHLPENTAIFLDEGETFDSSSRHLQLKTDVLTYLLRDKAARRPRDIKYILLIRRTRGVSTDRLTYRGYLVAIIEIASGKVQFHCHLRRSRPKTLKTGPAIEIPVEDGEEPMILFSTNDDSFRLLEKDLENTIRKLGG